MDADPVAEARRLPLAKRDVFFHNRALALRAQVTCAGRETRSGGDGYDWRGLARGSTEFSVFQYTIAGEGRLQWGRQHYALTPGTAMLVRVPHDHRYWLPDGGHWEFLWVCVIGGDVAEAWRAVHDRFGPVLDCSERPNVVAAAVRSVRAVLGEPGLTPYRASALAYELAMALDEAAGTVDRRSRDAGLERAARHCREHLGENVAVSQLARLAGLSRHHFARRFRAVYGKGPKEYLTDLRIQHAAQLLREGKQVKEVADATAFTDATYFCKVFRRLVGMTPGEFRDTGMFG